MNIIIIGPQASGKGTQAEKLAEKFNLTYFQMGKIFREMSKKPTPEGKRIFAFVLSGNPVPDDLTMKTANNYFSKINNLDNFIFDGIPRTPGQIGYFEDLIKKKGQKIDLVIYLSLPKEKIFERLANRRTCNKCGRVYNILTKPPIRDGVCDVCGAQLIIRDDETPQSILRRLSWFDEFTVPVIEHFRAKGMVEEVSGNRPIEVIFKDILERMAKRGLPQNGRN